jgi:hypothetical protein
MSTKVHAIVKISPRGRNTGTSVSKTNFIYQLKIPIHFKERQNPLKQYYVRIQNVKIPTTFYNINSNYDTFGWTGSTTGAVSFTITHGNYTIDEMIAEIKTQMDALDLNTYTLTYNEITMKVNIASTGTENVATLVGNGWQTIGFDLTETITGASNVTGTNVASTNTQDWVKIIIDNLNTSNYYENDSNANTQLQRVGIDIPITQSRQGFELFDNNDGPMYKLPAINSIIELKVRLVDKFNNDLELNGEDWECMVVFYEYNKYPLPISGIL